MPIISANVGIIKKIISTLLKLNLHKIKIKLKNLYKYNKCIIKIKNNQI